MKTEYTKNEIEQAKMEARHKRRLIRLRRRRKAKKAAHNPPKQVIQADPKLLQWDKITWDRNDEFTSVDYMTKFIRERCHRPQAWSRFKLIHCLPTNYYNTLSIFDKEFLKVTEATKILKRMKNKPTFDGNRFLEFRALRRRNIFHFYPVATGNVYVPTKEVTDELLRREILCYIDMSLFNLEARSTKQAGRHQSTIKRQKRKKGTACYKFELEIGDKKFLIGWFTSLRKNSLTQIIKKLEKNKQIFNKDNEVYVNPDYLKLFGRRIQHRKIKYEEYSKPVEYLIEHFGYWSETGKYGTELNYKPS